MSVKELTRDDRCEIRQQPFRCGKGFELTQSTSKIRKANLRQIYSIN